MDVRRKIAASLALATLSKTAVSPQSPASAHHSDGMIAATQSSDEIRVQVGYGRVYGVGREWFANRGDAVQRAEVAGIQCGSNFGEYGFLYNALWQTVGNHGNGNPAEWIETGTTYCEPLVPWGKWVIASCLGNYGGDCLYQEEYLPDIIPPAGTAVTFKIRNINAYQWEVWINGARRRLQNVPNTGFSNYGQSGLEVLNRVDGSQPNTLETYLQSKVGSTTWQYWAGQDSCLANEPAEMSWFVTDYHIAHNLAGANGTC